jgi:DNA-binding IclR family transcriptional regulator
MEAADEKATAGVDRDRPEDFVQSVGRAVRLLEVVGKNPGLPVKSIARRSGLNIATTYHLVRTLAYEGYLLRLPDGTYVIGDAVARRFHDLLGSLGRPPESTVVLQHLVERTGLSAYLGCLKAGRLTVAEVVEGPRSPYLEDFESGLDVSAHATALGKALLSALPRRERRSYLAEQGLRRFTARTRTDVDTVDTELSSVRQGEPVTESGEFRDGVACVACLVPRRSDDGTWWGLVLSIRDVGIPVPVRTELVLASRDLATRAHPASVASAATPGPRW